MQIPILEPQSIEKLIPQRSPMILVDSLWEYNETSAITGLTITPTTPFVHGDSFAESGLIEHLAQSIALHKGYSYYLAHQPAPMGYIGAIKHIEIYRPLQVGEVLKTHISILQEFMGVTLVKLSSFINNENICIGEMKTVLA